MKTDNKIVNDDQYIGNIKTTRPVNVNGIYNLNGDLSFGFPIRALKGNINVSNNASYFRNKQIVNGVENTSNTFTTGPDIRLDMNFGEKANVSVGGGVNYNKTNYTLSSARDITYLSQVYSADFSWQLPKNFYFSTDFVYTINNQLSDGFNAKVPFWNASVSKQFLRFNRGELKLKAYDLLNQNVGVSRNSNQNYVEDIRQRNLQRFFLLSFTYSLNKNGLAQGSASGGRMIMR